MPKVLIIDDEEKFRESLSQRLQLRGYANRTLPDGHDAIKVVRNDQEIDVVILDRRMPGLSGEETLREIKNYRPELQVIMLTGHGDTQSAVEAGRLDAYSYLQKPCDLDTIISTVDEARVVKSKAMARHEIPEQLQGSLKKFLIGSHNSRPGFILLGLVIFALIVFAMPSPELVRMLDFKKTGDATQDINLGYSDYSKLKIGESIADYYSVRYKIGHTVTGPEGKKIFQPLTAEETAFKARIMLAVLAVAALFWASGALPIGITSLLVGVIMYLFGVLQPDEVAQAYAKDSVIFIFGVLAFAMAISKTGLDRRIGLLLLNSSRSLPAFLFLFLPLFGMTCSFLSEHALIAFTMPVLLIVYLSSIRAAGVTEDKSLAVLLMLSVNFAANSGGPGSPAAGGRNAVMMGILSDYGAPPTFLEWVMYGLPFVPVMCLAIGLYFYLTVYRKTKVRSINVSTIVRQASEKIGPMTREEYVTAGVLLLLVGLWITCSDVLGLGGPVILAIVLLNIFRIMTWRDVTRIPWEVVALYAAATAMGKGLSCTGGALYLADSFIDVLPEYFTSGAGLAIAASIFTGVITNFMSDGATVSAIGPITVPMAKIASTPTLMVGLATAFASSFAHMFVIGTPNNAIVFAMAKNPRTGEQLISLTDFMKHGAIVLLLSFAVLWFWIILGYWHWIGF